MIGPRRKIWAKWSSAVAGCIGLLALAAPAANASLEFSEVGVSVKGKDGAFSRQAGGHSNFSFRFVLPAGPPELPRDIDTDLPPGFYGNPTKFPSCTLSELLQNECTPDAQIGTVEVKTGGGGLHINPTVGLFNLKHGPEVPARFAFKFITATATITPRVRPTDYGISAGSFQIDQTEAVEAAKVTLWDVPADPSHNFERHNVMDFEVNDQVSLPSHAPNVPFFTNPTACSDTPSEFRAEGDSWENPGIFDEWSTTADEEGTPFIWEGCENLPFDPTITLAPGTHAAHSPSGLHVSLSVPNNESPNGLAEATMKETVVELPEGMTISPGAAAGQTGCSKAQVGLKTNDPPTCPESSKLGTVEIETPLLEAPLEGDVVLASQGDNPFGSNFALYLLVKGPGFYLKLPGKLTADPATGQLKTVFSDLPQLPFENLDLQLRGGQDAPLQTPSACGDYSIRTVMTSWARPDEPVVQETPVKINENCGGSGFGPTLSGWTLNPIAGAHSPFTVEIQRQDGEQDLSRIDVTLPEGQLASLKGVAECPEAAAATAACPASSEIGSASALVGTGPAPLLVPQPGKSPTAFYLGGPYKGAPLSVIAKVPAQAGPFDFGNIVVRTALQVDPTSAQVTAKSDPLPQIIEGVPLSYRNISIQLTRSNFTVNPTSCEPKQIKSVLTSATGQTAAPSARYQVAGCGELGFKPSLKLSLKGKMNRTGNPALKAVLKMPKANQANIAKTTVVLPPAMFIDNSHINNPCTRVQFNANDCPAGSVLGQATAYSPLLDKPLSGQVYFRSNGGDRELPDLVADLKGQIHVTLVGFIDTAKSGGVRTRFADVPDAPVSKFVLKLSGGKKGLIENSENLCSFTPKAKVQMTGQNGKVANTNLKLGTSCGKK